MADLPAAEIEQRRLLLRTASAHWSLIPVDRAILERARRPFPSEPIKTLDALHLASALRAAESVKGLAVLSLDHRVRASAHTLGLDVLPVA